MSVTAVSGQNLSSTILANRIVIDMSAAIAWLEPDATSLLSILQQMKKEPAKSFKVEWLSRQPLPYYIQAAAAGDASGAGSLTITDYAFLRVGDVLINDRTNEVIRVTATPTTSTVAVVRGAGTTHAAILASDRLYRAGSAEEEGDTSPVSRGIKDDTDYNYTQIFKNTASQSRTLSQTKLYGEPNRATEEKWHGMEHKKALERAICWGELKTTTGPGGDPLRMTKGLFSDAGYIQTNRFDAVAGITEDDFNEYLEDIFEYGSDTKIGFGGKVALRTLNAFAKDKLQVIHPSGDKGKLNYGISIRLWQGADGSTTQLIKAKQWKGPTKARMLGVVDLKNIRLRPLQDTVLKKDIQENDRDGWKDQWLTEVALECKLEQTHGLIYNM